MSIQTEPETSYPETTYSALDHTITTEGDWPRCADCGEYGSHPEHQPDALAAAEGALYGPTQRGMLCTANLLLVIVAVGGGDG